MTPSNYSIRHACPDRARRARKARRAPGEHAPRVGACCSGSFAHGGWSWDGCGMVVGWLWDGCGMVVGESWALHLDVLSHSHHHGRRLGGQSFRALVALSVSSLVHGVPQPAPFVGGLRGPLADALIAAFRSSAGCPEPCVRKRRPPRRFLCSNQRHFLAWLDACSRRVVGSTSLSRFVVSLPDQLSLGAAVRGTSSFLA
jgi:hypothetical protein